MSSAETYKLSPENCSTIKNQWDFLRIPWVSVDTDINATCWMKKCPFFIAYITYSSEEGFEFALEAGDVHIINQILSALNATSAFELAEALILEILILGVSHLTNTQSPLQNIPGKQREIRIAAIIPVEQNGANTRIIGLSPEGIVYEMVEAGWIQREMKVIR